MRQKLISADERLAHREESDAGGDAQHVARERTAAGQEDGRESGQSGLLHSEPNQDEPNDESSPHEFPRHPRRALVRFVDQRADGQQVELRKINFVLICTLLQVRSNNLRTLLLLLGR